MPKTIGDRIRQARIARGLTTTAVAKALGDVERSAISQWEHGHTSPKLPRVQAVARVLGVDTTWLMTGEGDSGLTPTRIDRMLGIDVMLWSQSDMLARKPSPGSPILRTHFTADKTAFAHRLQSRMLEPLVSVGSIIVVSPGSPVEPGCIVAATSGGRVAFGRLHIDGSGKKETWCVAPIDPALGKIPIARQDLMGVVSEATFRLSHASSED